ncbi:tripartite tricarboxylate transporter TctB family protein [Brevibacillus agri]|uniref:tripartite tricarboxylate transporter TctB family protein n=1 Tax=Brevibacillus agri TaxID=51101 RepID=UPI002E23B33A|nr:tripartite tricarboxylate transporter TctB family protein [Brevibacillus agri]MED1657223.1 tripartite tricarboxylate transporter TctB family protein [Brevibacillus agri]MED1689612.1 tripartite tricarboxylate transporter TctB family protein [Brevibacillus agri]MED1693898.1 tripartite tricarboxylate transporter TctB family protein [Brevibacillus agri]MED1698274.1 tripartite tricarboxylate transporter TctB family protein [Brevibacillus agri]
MRLPQNVPDFIGAVWFIVMGIVVCVEAFRLQAFSQSQYVGDHTLPTVLGILFVLLGGALLFQSYRVTEGPVAAPSSSGYRFLLCQAGLFLYCLLIATIGYLLATLFISAALFRIIGSYQWGKVITCALLLTGSLYVVFIVWLQITFPAGFFF